ncbi:sodium- and chloride-dependent neutral and basic amino acid transporter B(0+) [Protopterus annectens]|uniref:sodium- and chloride-dependent neutral and basic amino acid transporter B(0+) n=1 Tax=Protopterus annectens TaxID=7888 RepID=UPI001CFB3C2C|nr:sodium- and chloride-dependent neutral and basic amino acid transporter B(0+) [Protopterus annectens]
MNKKKLALSDLSVFSFQKKAAKEEQGHTNNSNVEQNDENTERGNWSSKTEYLLSMVGYAVGLGNVWRFPYLAYRNGGGAFLIPYTIMLAFAGLPLFFLECSLGQFASLGPISVWNIVPIIKGVGITMVLVSAFVSMYYNCIIGYSLYYMFASFQSRLPWADCSEWSDKTCSKTPLEMCNMTTNYSNPLIVNMTWLQENNLTCANQSILRLPYESPTEQYWDKVALRRSSGMDETGEIVWHLALSLLLAWIIVGAALFKGVQSSGKVVYFTAIFPYVVLVILFIRGVTLAGARDGIEYYIGTQSDITRLTDSEVWKDAATQIFFSLSTAWGGLIALASYNKFHSNSFSDAILVCVTNCLTSVFAGFAIFSVLGHIAYISQKPVSEVAQSGFGLAFIAYPAALAELPVAPLWSILFFFMLVTLGLDSQFASIETLTTALQDEFPNYLRSRKPHTTVICCVVLFLLGLVCVTRAGIYWINLIDHFCAGWVLIIAAVLELIAVGWVYGANRFIKDIEMMIGEKTWLFWLWWRACWYFISPCLLLIILLWSLVTFSPPSYGSTKYPAWGIALGWCMISFCIIWIPILAIIQIVRAKGSLWERIKQVASPAANWGPALECHYGERYKHLLAAKTKESHVNVSYIETDEFHGPMTRL